MPAASAPTPAPEVPSRDDLRALLLDRQFGTVQRLFQELHAAHASGTLTEQELERAYAVASCYREELTPALRAWAAAFPQSYPAQVALGVHLFGQGLKLRTMRLARDIPEENLDALAGAFGAAGHQLTYAMTLDARATLAFIYLIFLQMQRGERAWDEYHEGLRRAPDSLHLRLAMLRHLRTEWGGSDAAQDNFLTRPEHASLREEDRAELEATRLRQRAHFLAHFAGDPAPAVHKPLPHRSGAQWTGWSERTVCQTETERSRRVPCPPRRSHPGDAGGGPTGNLGTCWAGTRGVAGLCGVG